MVHAIEAYISRAASPFSDAMAEKALELIGGNIAVNPRATTKAMSWPSIRKRFEYKHSCMPKEAAGTAASFGAVGGEF